MDNPGESTDQELECIDCHGTFLFTGGEQDFFKLKGFTTPKRCKPCRDAKKQMGAKGGDSRNFNR